MLKLKFEMRVAGVKPLPRKGARRLEPPRFENRMLERLDFTPNLANHLGAKVPYRLETRECNICHVVYHLAIFCTHPLALAMEAAVEVATAQEIRDPKEMSAALEVATRLEIVVAMGLEVAMAT